MSERTPAEVWSLAEYLAEEMEERGWTVADVALRMGDESEYGVNFLAFGFCLAVQDDNFLLDDKTARGVARAFGVSEEFVRNLDNGWREQKTGRVAFECPEHLFAPRSDRRQR